jgi:nucleoprotein TPR
VVIFPAKKLTLCAGQADASRQEAVRLKQQLDHALRNLDEARALARAAEERLTKETESTAQHQAAVSQLSQLNLMRESNVTLRDENERAQKRVRELQAALAEAEGRVMPLQEERAQLAALRDVLQTEKVAFVVVRKKYWS